MTWIIAAIVIIYVVATEFLDWKGRAEIIQNNYPKLWKFVGNRPFRLILLLFAIGLLIQAHIEKHSTVAPPSEQNDRENSPEAKSSSKASNTQDSSPQQTANTATPQPTTSAQNFPPNEQSSHPAKTQLSEPSGDIGVHPSPYVLEKAVSIGHSLTDPLTGTSVGLIDISVYNFAKMILTMPGSRQLHIDKGEPGNTWKFRYHGKTYTVMLAEVNFVGQNIKVRIAEAVD